MAESDGADEQVKDAFKAALERKKNRSHPHEDASQSGGKAGDAHGAAGGKRVHRRKSG